MLDGAREGVAPHIQKGVLMARSNTRLGAGCAGVLAGLALAATPALADSAAPAGYQPSGPLGAMGVLPAAPAPNAVESQYFGGFDITPSEGISSAGSTFKLPKFTCPDSGVVQLDGFGEWIDNSTGNFYVEGGDTDALAVGSLECTDGVGAYEINAGTTNGGEEDDVTDVNAGDVIQTRVEELPSGDVVATVADLTSGQQVSSEGASLGDEAQITEGLIPDAFAEQFQSDYGIPKFKTVKFSRSQVGGLPLAEVDPTPTELDQDGPVQIVPSAIPTKHPGAFTLTEKSDS
jgi:hypothetical protein